MQFRSTITFIQPVVADAGSVADCNATKKNQYNPLIHWIGSSTRKTRRGVLISIVMQESVFV